MNAGFKFQVRHFNKKLFRFRYDNAYKWLITFFLKDAIEFLHPNLFGLIDWDIDCIYHEQELANLSKIIIIHQG